MQFEPFPKLPRLSRKCVISEKIDGTNASVGIVSAAVMDAGNTGPGDFTIFYKDFFIYAGSRTRWLKPEGEGPKGCDNFGFAAWVRDNAECLLQLGEGRHFGEWWGQGIQRNYGLTEKRFSLFNAERWQSARPECCYCVPVLYRGPFTSDAVESTLNMLREKGSFGAPEFMKPEGIVIYHAASNSMFKKTIEKDDEPKGKQS